ncbi:ATP-binding protein [candidate division KSB1 bacterium]|nr:ATP-binding protein [candidate division KSB1 bacterium]
MQTIPVLLALIENCFKNGYYKIIFDMARIKFPSSSFIALLIELTSKARRAGGDLKLLNLAPSAINNLVTFSILNYLASETNIQTAIEELDELKLKPGVTPPEPLPDVKASPDVKAMSSREISDSTRPVAPLSQTTPTRPGSKGAETYMETPSIKPQTKNAEPTRPVTGGAASTVRPVTSQPTLSPNLTAANTRVGKAATTQSMPPKITTPKPTVEKTTSQKTIEARTSAPIITDQKPHPSTAATPPTRAGNDSAPAPPGNLEPTKPSVLFPAGKSHGTATQGTDFSEKTPRPGAGISATSPLKPEGNRIRVKSKVESLYEICDFVTEFARQMGFPEKELGKIKVTIYEAALNIIEHAYHSDPDEWIVVSVQREGQKMTTILQDWGERFQFDDSRQYNVDQAVKDRKTGGFGLFIIRRSMDEVKYKTDPVNGNRLILIKELH